MSRFALPTPTLLDRAIAYVAPRAAMDRLRARAQFAFYTAHIGASFTEPSLEHHRPVQRDPDADTLDELPTLRARSRDAARNDPLAKSIITSTVTSVVGTGIVPQPRLDPALLGITEAQADEIEATIAFLWEVHGREIDLHRRMPRHVQQQQALRSMMVDGDVLPVRVWDPQLGCAFATRIQHVEADRTCNPHFAVDTERLRGGVSLSATGVHERFHVLERGYSSRWQYGAWTWREVPAFLPQTGERNAALCAMPGRPGQVRGVPELSAILLPLQQLSRYARYELDAASVQSLFNVFLTYPKEKTEADALALPTAGLPGVPGAGVTAPRGELPQYELSPAGVSYAPEGYQVTSVNPSRPNANYAPFWEACVTGIAAGGNLPKELVLKHFQASYSASKAAFLEAWRWFLDFRHTFVMQYCALEYEWMLLEAVARGYLRLPGFAESPLRRAAWLSAVWQGPVQGDIDEVKAATAAEIRMRARITTLDEETLRMTGQRWEPKHRQIVKERRWALADGLPVSAAPAPPPSAPNAPDADEAPSDTDLETRSAA